MKASTKIILGKHSFWAEVAECAAQAVYDGTRQAFEFMFLTGFMLYVTYTIVDVMFPNVPLN